MRSDIGWDFNTHSKTVAVRQVCRCSLPLRLFTNSVYSIWTGDYVDDTPYVAAPNYDCTVGTDSCPSQPGMNPVRPMISLGSQFLFDRSGHDRELHGLRRRRLPHHLYRWTVRIHPAPVDYLPCRHRLLLKL
jgi:hypothetical protein